VHTIFATDIAVRESQKCKRLQKHRYSQEKNKKNRQSGGRVEIGFIRFHKRELERDTERTQRRLEIADTCLQPQPKFVDVRRRFSDTPL